MQVLTPSEVPLLIRMIENLGTAALVLILLYRLADKFFTKLLGTQAAQSEAMVKQADATVVLANTIQESLAEQREVGVAIRVLAAKMEATRDFMRDVVRPPQSGGTG